MNMKSALKLAGLVSAAALLTPATLILGAAPMLTIRKTFGRLGFWLPLLSVAASFAVTGAWAAGLVLLVVTVLIGVYCEVESHGSTTFNSAVVGVLASVGAASLSVGGYLWRAKLSFLPMAHEAAENAIRQFSQVNQTFALTADDLLQQLPSVVLMSLFVTLWCALLWERPLRVLFRLELPIVDERLSAFRVPDIGLWLAILALAGALIKHGNTTLEVVAINVLNVMVVAYFFQGLAIVSHGFRLMKLGPGWRAVWYVLFVLYLNFIMSLLGFLDFWFDFRERMTRKPVQTGGGFLNR